MLFLRHHQKVFSNPTIKYKLLKIHFLLYECNNLEWSALLLSYRKKIYFLTMKHCTICVRAEHSKYLIAPISVIICSPSWYEMGAKFFSLSCAIVSLSSLKSSLVPTKIIGVLGQWCVISGYHCWKKGWMTELYSNGDVLVLWCSHMKFGWPVKNRLKTHPRTDSINIWSFIKRTYCFWVAKGSKPVIILLAYKEKYITIQNHRKYITLPGVSHSQRLIDLSSTVTLYLLLSSLYGEVLVATLQCYFTIASLTHKECTLEEMSS